MKKIFGLLTVGATLAILSLPVFANTTSTLVNETLQDPAQDACGTDAKIALYNEIIANLQKDQAKAYEGAKKYVACPSEGADEAEMKRVNYLKSFITKYEKADRKAKLTNQIVKKEIPAAFETAKLVFADDPAYLKGYMALALAGAVSGNQAVATDTIAYAKKALEMIEGGTTPDNWAPFDNKDDALAKLNYAIGSLSAANSPDTAITHLIKAAGYNSKIKTAPITYVYLAEAYERGPYAKQSAEYKEKFGNQPETPESKLAFENINQIIDRQIDAYARAVNLAGTDPNKTEWMKALTDWYKFRNKGDESGLPAYVAGIMSKPLPPVPTPLTSLPTPAATPTTSNGSATPTGTGTGNGATSAAQPMVNQPKTMTPATAKPAATPASTSKPAPGKPKTRKAHVRGN
jgi:tetratricopeptide (TPR) repeat protein